MASFRWIENVRSGGGGLCRAWGLLRRRRAVCCWGQWTWSLHRPWGTEMWRRWWTPRIVHSWWMRTWGRASIWCCWCVGWTLVEAVGIFRSLDVRRRGRGFLRWWCRCCALIWTSLAVIRSLCVYLIHVACWPSRGIGCLVGPGLDCLLVRRQASCRCLLPRLWCRLPRRLPLLSMFSLSVMNIPTASNFSMKK